MDPRMGPVRIPGVPDGDLPGRLIVLEGTDGVGRSTQMRLLRNWLESSENTCGNGSCTNAALLAAITLQLCLISNFWLRESNRNQENCGK